MTQIFLPSGYRGRPSQEQYIKAGTYDIQAPELFGAGEYLLDNGFAVDTARVIPQPEIQYQDRDMSGRPIVVKLPQAQPVIDPVVPVYEQPANRLDAADMAAFLRAQGYAVSAPEPPPPAMPPIAELVAYLQAQGLVVIAPPPADMAQKITPDDEPDDFSDLELASGGDSATDEKPLESYTLPELKKMARDLELALKSDDSKSVIIAKIRAAQET